MPAIPNCRRLGPHCFGLSVVLRVAELDDGPGSADAEATWLLGHTERITFGRLRRKGNFLYCRAKIQVPCHHLRASDSEVRCLAHGYSGTPGARATNGPKPATRRHGTDRFEYVSRGRLVTGLLRRQPDRTKRLPVLDSSNPCATAACRTADNRIGAACCRDLQLEILCSPRAKHLEALIRSRRPPFLCKVDREESDSLGAEVISACAYLDDDGRLCTLHGRRRPDGREAKPELCFSWPGKDATFHRDCVFKKP